MYFVAIPPRNCAEWYNNFGVRDNTIVEIDLGNGEKTLAYCDMRLLPGETKPGGWIVIQK